MEKGKADSVTSCDVITLDCTGGCAHVTQIDSL